MFVNYFVQVLSKLDPDLRNVLQNDERVTEVLRQRYSKHCRGQGHRIRVKVTA